MSSSAVVVIPARWGSTRFPGKPLCKILGKTLIERVWRAACRAESVDQVLVATDDDRIAEHVAALGGRPVLTDRGCANGTERVRAALEVAALCPDIIVNLQGDAVLTPPRVIDALVEVMRVGADVDIATPALRFSWEQLDQFVAERKEGQVGGTTVTFARNGDALYFSKAVIPNIRKRAHGPCPVFRHIGLYAYTRSALDRWLSLPPTPLEEVEQLEQLRALEHGMRIRVIEVDYGGRPHGSVDNPSDVAFVEQVLRAEGEASP